MHKFRGNSDVADRKLCCQQKACIALTIHRSVHSVFFERIGFAFQVTYVKIIMNTYLKIVTAKK